VSAHECPFESAILEALAAGRWPEAESQELRDHADTCEVCRDVALVANVFRQDYGRLSADGEVPSAARVWWRAQMRARAEAARAAERPIAVVHALAAACCVGLLMAAVTLAWPWLAEHVPVWLAQSDTGAVANEGEAGWAILRPAGLALIVAIAAFVVAPLVLFFAFTDD
jgi:hypothetical protein